jgi:replicative DNA helicase
MVIFDAMKSLHKKNVKINSITVAQELNEKDKLELVGGAAKFPRLISETPTSFDCPEYAAIVKRMSLYRQLIASSERIAAIAYDGKMNIDDALAEADNYILKLRQQSGTSDVVTPAQRVERMMDRYTRLYTNIGGIAVPTGLSDLDKKLGGGLFPGDLTVIAARTGVGKTAFANCVAQHISLNTPVLLCSGEMSDEAIGDRMVAGAIGKSVNLVRYGGYDEDTLADIYRAVSTLEKYQIYTREARRGFSLTTPNIYQTAYELKLREGLGLLVIDYLGLVKDRYGQNSNERLGYITKQIKEIAQTLDVPVLLLHQLNRDIEKRPLTLEDGSPGRYPQISDLRESGQIEEDADNILFLYREDYYKPETENKTTDILISKVRQDGAVVGKGVKVVWDAKAQTYRGMSKVPLEQEHLI